LSDLFAALRSDRLLDVPLKAVSANLHVAGEDGWSLLALAAVRGQLNRLPTELLTERNMLTKDRDGDTPLHWAAKSGCLDQVPESVLAEDNLLVKNNEGLSPFWEAARQCPGFGVPKHLITERMLMTTDRRGRTALELLAGNGNIDMIYGTELSPSCRDHIAMGFGSIELAKLWYERNLTLIAAKAKENLVVNQEVPDVELF